jgi:peptidoglycan/LPS O-acetylase OafA/YrhL
MPCRADALSWGILLAVGWRDAHIREWIRGHAALLQRALSFGFLGVSALLWWLVHPLNIVTVTIGYTWFALVFSALLLTAVSQPAGWIAAIMRWRSLGWIGGISYCVYILHDPFNFFAHRILLHAEPRLQTLPQLSVSLLALLLTLAVASLSWRYFEKPLIRKGHRYSYDRL